MFAVIVAGRLVQTDVTMIDETKFMFTLMEMDNVNHIVVFMTGQQPFPNGIGASVFINWPSQAGENSWQLIGHLTNDKPSAIFKLSGLQKGDSTSSNVFSSLNNLSPLQHPHHAQLGISLESLSEISQQVPVTASSSTERLSTFAEFSTAMITNFYNYASSFSKSLEEIVSIASSCDQSVAKTQFIPASVLEGWMKMFQSKLARDIEFWKK